MSRQIPDDRPLTDEDRQYLHARSLGWRIAQIDALFPPTGEVKVVGDAPKDDDLSNLIDITNAYSLAKFDKGLVDEVKGLSIKELQENLKDLGVEPITGRKNELQWRLAKAITITEDQAVGESGSD